MAGGEAVSVVQAPSCAKGEVSPLRRWGVVEDARACCTVSMQGMLRGDLTRVHPFVVSLMDMLTLGMPDPRDRSAFVEHVTLRTTCVLGDLFALVVRGEEADSLTDKEGGDEGSQPDAAAEPPALRSMLRLPLCVAGGAIMAHRIVAPALVAGCVFHPSVVRRVGIPLAGMLALLVFFARVMMTLEAGASFLAGLLCVDVGVGFPLLTACTCGGRRSPTRPSPS